MDSPVLLSVKKRGSVVTQIKRQGSKRSEDTYEKEGIIFVYSCWKIKLQPGFNVALLVALQSGLIMSPGAYERNS